MKRTIVAAVLILAMVVLSVGCVDNTPPQMELDQETVNNHVQSLEYCEKFPIIWEQANVFREIDGIEWSVVQFEVVAGNIEHDQVITTKATTIYYETENGFTSIKDGEVLIPSIKYFAVNPTKETVFDLGGQGRIKGEYCE